MMKCEDDLGVSCLRRYWSREGTGQVYEEELRKTEKRNHESSSFSLRVIDIDLNEPPLLSDSETDDEKQSEAKIGDHEIHNGASSSSYTSSSWLRNNIDLNEPPSVSEREEPQNPARFSLSLLGDHSISKNPPNPNHQSRKRPLERMGRSIGSLKKAKKSRLQAALEVEGMMLIFKKTLSKSDVNPGQSRILIPFNQLERNDFLTQVESRLIQQEEDEEGEKPGVGAILVNHRSESWGVMFKRWVMKKKDSENVTLNYVLNCGWNDIVKVNELKANDKISLWSFRFHGVLCFALRTHPSTMAQSSSSDIS